MSQALLLDVPAITHPPGASDEFYTPRERFAEWNHEFSFTLDACATKESACLSRFYDKETDGLLQGYAGERVWCNPPYSDIAPWVELAHEQMVSGCALWVHLLPANRTDQSWWQDLIECQRDGGDSNVYAVETRFVRGRMKFGFPGDPSGKSGHSPTFGSVLVIWRSMR